MNDESKQSKKYLFVMCLLEKTASDFLFIRKTARAHAHADIFTHEPLLYGDKI